MIGVDRENAQQKVAFYTVAMSEDEEEVRASVRLGLAYTPNLKFKMGSDLDFGKKLMLVADEVFREVVPEDVRRNALVWMQCIQPQTRLPTPFRTLRASTTTPAHRTLEGIAMLSIPCNGCAVVH